MQGPTRFRLVSIAVMSVYLTVAQGAACADEEERIDLLAEEGAEAAGKR